jgi:hypothetical protein
LDKLLKAATGKVNSRSSVRLSYQSMAPLKRWLSNPKSRPMLKVRVSSQRMSGSTALGRLVVKRESPNWYWVSASPLW